MLSGVGLGKAMRRCRKGRLTQDQLAEKLDVSQSLISQWETDTTVPDAVQLVQVAVLLECSVDDLVVGADTKYDQWRTRATSAHAKKTKEEVTGVTYPGKGSGVQNDAQPAATDAEHTPNQGRSLNASADQHNQTRRQRPLTPVPPDARIIQEFVGFANLLTSIAEAYSRGEISSTRLRSATRAAVRERNDRVPLRPGKKKKS